MVVFQQSGCIPVKMVVFGQSCCNREKLLVFGQSGCNPFKKFFFGQKVVIIDQSGCIREIVVALGLNG